MTKKECLFDGREFQISNEQTRAVAEILAGPIEVSERQQYHRVLEAIGLPIYDWIEQGYDTHHIDGNHSNNVPSNLMVVTRKRHMIEERLDKKRAVQRDLNISKTMSEHWENITEEKREHHALAVSKGNIIYWQNMSEEKREQRGIAMSKGQLGSRYVDPLQFPESPFDVGKYALMHNMSPGGAALRLAGYCKNNILVISRKGTGRSCHLYSEVQQ